VQIGGLVEDRDDIDGLDRGKRLAGQEQPGVVVDHVEDLDVGAAGQAPVGDVGLPHLVRQLCLEADQRAARALLRLGSNKPLPLEDPPDRRARGHLLAPYLLGEVVGDGLCAAVMALSVQLLAQPHDRTHDLLRGFPRRSMRAS
jgi:hypothetical protein